MNRRDVSDDLPPLLRIPWKQAIQKTKHYIQRCHAREVILPMNTWDKQDESKNGQRPTTNDQRPMDVLDSLLNRVDEIPKSKQHRQEEDLRIQFQKAIQDWLSSVSSSSSTTSTTNSYKVSKSTSTAAPSSLLSSSPIILCAKYLWKMQSHPKGIMRRVSLILCGHLACGNYLPTEILDTNERWLNWLSSIIEIQQPTGRGRDKEEDIHLFSLWKKESLLWIYHLQTLYPTNNRIRVAAMYLEQQGISIHIEGTDTQRRMADWRAIRDIAMKHADHQLKIIDRLIQRSYDCMDIIMPRIGMITTTTNTTTTQQDTENSNTHSSVDHPNDDGDDIEWEDGDLDDVASRHVAAVDQTLSLLQSIGVLKEGDMKIQLGASIVEEETETVLDKESLEAAQRKHSKIIKSLSTKYLPCLSGWVNALLQADNLTLSKNVLLVLSQETIQHRQGILHQFLERKQTMTNLIATASRMTNYSIKNNDQEIPSNQDRKRQNCSGLSFTLSILPTKKRRKNPIQVIWKNDKTTNQVHP